MATERRIVTVPPDFFPPDHVRKGSRFSLDGRVGRITAVHTVKRAAALRLTVELEAS